MAGADNLVPCPRCRGLARAGTYCDCCGEPLGPAGDAGPPRPPPATAPADPGAGLAGAARGPAAGASPVPRPDPTTTRPPTPAAWPLPAEPTTSRPPAAAGPPSGGDRPTTRTPPEAGRDERRALYAEAMEGGREAGGARMATATGLPPAASECRDLAADLDEGRIFVEGVSMPFNVRLTGGLSPLHHLHLKVSTQDITGRELSTELKVERLRERQVRNVGLDFHSPAQLRGLKTFTWRVTYEAGGCRRQFEGQSQVTVYPGDESPGQVIDKVIFNIQTGAASDVHVSDAAADYYRQLRGSGASPLSVRDLVDAARKAPPVWRGLVLYECEADPAAGPPPAQATCAKLTLRLPDGTLVHLLSGRRVTLGRNRQCDVVTRVFDAEGQATDALNTRLSRQHAAIEFGDAGVEIVDGDGGGETAGPGGSTWGVYLDRQRLPKGGRQLLPCGRPAEIGLGSPASAEPGGLALATEVIPARVLGSHTCPAPARCPPEAAAVVVLRRLDRVREVFVVLKACVDGNRVLPELEGLRLRRTQGSYAYTCGPRVGWLAPGTPLFLPTGLAVEVLEHRQWGL